MADKHTKHGSQPSHNQADKLSELMPTITTLYIEWCRLKGYSLGRTPLEISIDKATGYEASRMKEFAAWFNAEILGRLPRKDSNG